MGPLVSIIVPTRNSAWVLETCLRSVKNQTYANIELIVVDNYSTDGSRAIAQEYTDLVFDKGPERNIQRPYGASLAQGEYLMFIDSDMELPPSLVEAAVNRCQEGGYDAIILPEVSAGNGFWARCRGLQKLCLLNDPYMELANRFMKADVYNAIGGYDPGLVGPEDSDIHQRIKRGGYKIGRINHFISHHEEASLARILGKSYLYGKYLPLYFKRYPGEGFQQFVLRSAYLRNWRLFLKDPLHGAGLMFMHLLQYAAVALGALDGLFRGRRQTGVGR